ncbi:MAG TPA: hypothetical protein VFE51_31470 [Verrucomicrobiae bacterium]|nr:hypothetical protein [Verrucomicrobiae bacterium]
MKPKPEKITHGSLVHPITAKLCQREFSNANAAERARERAGLDPGMALLVDMLKRQRQRKRMTPAGLARRARVSLETIQKFEAYQLNLIGLLDLLSIGTALGSKLTVQLAPIKPELPCGNTEILREFDRLVKSRKCNPFIRKSPDRDHKGVLWDIVGDKERNWLFVVASNPKKRVRFAAVTDQPGGWSIAGQVFGIDAETNQVADELAEKLMKQHRDELT